MFISFDCAGTVARGDVAKVETNEAAYIIISTDHPGTVAHGNVATIVSCESADILSRSRDITGAVARCYAA